LSRERTGQKRSERTKKQCAEASVERNKSSRGKSVHSELFHLELTEESTFLRFLMGYFPMYRLPSRK